MITTIVSDFSRVILFPKDEMYSGDLNPMHTQFRKRNEYNPLDYFVFNEEYLSFLSSLKDIYALYIFTSGHMQEDPRLFSRVSQIFEKIYTTSDTGYEKNDPRSYQKLADLLSTSPGNMLFIDDSSDNCKAAQDAGIESIHYINIESLFKQLQTKSLTLDVD